MNLEKVSDEELIKRYCASPSDRDAGEELFDRCRRRLERMSRSLAQGTLCPSWHSRDLFAEEVCDRTINKVVETVCMFEFRAKFDTWLHSIMKRKAIDVYRELVGRGEGPRIFKRLKDVHFSSKYWADPSEFVRQRELKDITVEMLRVHAQESRRSADSVDILRHRVWDGLTAKQIAKKRGIAEGTVFHIQGDDYEELRILLEKQFRITTPRDLYDR